VSEPRSVPNELSFTRVFEAPRELVFRCMIEPEHLTHFWGPSGVATPLETIKVDARPGGVFETVMVNSNDGSTYTMSVQYVEISEPERVVWSDSTTGMTTTSTFVDLGDGRTEVHVHQANVPEAFISADMQAGFSSSLDRFVGYIASISGDAGAKPHSLPA
jgi:uncharacterized protein YndB with AHSA1/START domain